MKRSEYLAMALILSGGLAGATDISGITVNGEASFDYNFLSSKGNGIPFTGGAPNETYRLNQAQILIKKETEQLSLLGRMVYAPTTYATSSTTTTKSNLGTLDQLEVFYKPVPNIYVGFGRFLTTMGFESLFKSENCTYGNSIAFQGIVPGYGEGVRAKYVPGEWLTATVSSYNQATYNAFGDDYTPTKTTEVSATGALGPFSWFAGYYFGKDGAAPADRTEKTSSSVWASYKFFNRIFGAVTYDSRTTKPDSAGTKWSDSISALASYQIYSNNTLAARYEMVRGVGELSDLASGLNYGTADKLNSITFTEKIALNDNFKVYVEYRTDQADEAVFNKDGGTSKDANLWTLGAVASF